MIIKSIRSFKFAFYGLLWVVKSENNAKIHAMATLLVIALSAYLKIAAREWLWIFLCIGLVWILEILNTALEKLVDLVSPGYHVEAGKIKDLGAAAVLVAAVFSLLCATLIFIPYL
jgi:diacylglycerol kinase